MGRLGDLVGSPLEMVGSALPDLASAVISNSAVLHKALETALDTMDTKSLDKGSRTTYKAMAVGREL